MAWTLRSGVVTKMIKTEEYESSLATVCFELDLSDLPYSPAQLTNLAIAALSVIGENLFSPITIDLALDYFNIEFGFIVPPPKQSSKLPFWWFLFSEEVLSQEKYKTNYSSIWNNSCDEVAESMDWKAIQAWIFSTIKRASCQSKFDQDSITIGWRALDVWAMQVALPENAVSSSSSTISILKNSRLIEYPISRKNKRIYIDAPLNNKSLQPPFKISMGSTYTILSMDIHMYWSLWTTPQSPGWLEFCQAIDRLKWHSDWRCTFSSLEGIKPDSFS